MEWPPKICAACEECEEDILDIPPVLPSLHGVNYDGKPPRCQNNTWLEGDIGLFLATLAIRNGGADLSDFYAFLDPPQASNFGSKALNKIESVIGQDLHDADEKGMGKTL